MTSERLGSSSAETSPLLAAGQWESALPSDGAPPWGLSSAEGARIRLDPDNVRNGLVRLVLTLIELIRELLERQALRRIDGGCLTGDEIERLGLTFLRLSEEMDRLKQQFGLSDEDLNLDLGPLGTLR